MGDASSSDTEVSNPAHSPKAHNNTHHHPFGGLEFQVSDLVGRLEASVNTIDETQPSSKMEPRQNNAGLLEPQPSTMNEMLQDLEDLVVKCDPSGDVYEPPLLPTEPVARAAILAHSLAALLGRLDRTHAARLGAHISNETTRWMSNLFRLSDYQAFYHQEHLEGLVRVTRMLLHHKYPRYLEDGALAFTNQLPCIYSSVASPLGVVQHLCRQLGLPLACVRPVPVHPSGRGMDVTALERLWEEDMESGRQPLLVLGEAGAPPLGCGSNLRALQAVCGTRGLHLHLRGHALALPAVYPNGQSFNVADSLTVTPGLWLGIPGLPTITFYRVPEPAIANDNSKVTHTSTTRESTLPALAGLVGGGARLPALSLWAAARAASHAALKDHLAQAFRSARVFYGVISQLGLRILSAKPGGDDPPNVDIIDIVSRASACVAFQFPHDPTSDSRPPPYYDKLNSWLGQVLQREADMVTIEVCETERHGVVLRYCPLEGGVMLDESGAEALQIAALAQVQVLAATAELRTPFQQRLQEARQLEPVNVPGWAGLGGVRYVPIGWEEAPVEELNSLNKQLVETLRATDNAFSCGEGEDGRACVRFGMVTADTDIDELLDLVLAAGKEVEESSKALSSMSEVLKKSIVEAEAELEKERAAGGVLRLVPVVGRVVQWWAPAPAPRGRALHLPTQALTHTDKILQRSEERKLSMEPPTNPSPTPQPPPPPQ